MCRRMRDKYNNILFPNFLKCVIYIHFTTKSIIDSNEANRCTTNESFNGFIHQ